MAAPGGWHLRTSDTSGVPSPTSVANVPLSTDKECNQNAHHCKNCVKNCAFWCPHLSRPHLALLDPTPSTNRYREMPPISQQACKKACEAIDHGMGQGYSLEDWYTWYLSEELTSEVMDNLTFAWFPDHDIIRLVPDLTDFPFSPENANVKAATPEMALSPLYDPDAIPSDQPPRPSSDQSDPWFVPKSMNFPKNLVVRNGIVFGYHSMTLNEAWNFMANGNTRLEPVQNNYTLEVKFL